MSLPHTLLGLGTAAGLWWGGHALSCSQPPLQPEASPKVFALPGSAYGSLMARLIRDSLYSYWHGGESATPAPAATASDPSKNAPAPPPPAGRFMRKNMPPPSPEPAPSSVSWIEAKVDRLSQFEKSRTRRNSTFPLSQAHQRFLNSAADGRLRLAYDLDPGDAVLYEILHFHIATRTQPPEAARSAALALADKAMAYGLRQNASLSDTLTGAGAAINLLNEQLMPENTQRDPQAIRRGWEALKQCLAHYDHIRATAQTEGWWDHIPPTRRQEIEEHAGLLQKIRGMIQKTLPADMSKE